MIKPRALSLYRPLTGARYRIVAFPHAGGGASAFMKLRAALAIHQVELCALQPPGRENRSADLPHRQIEALALEFSGAIETLSPLPSAFLGHSLGGLVAYLAARQLGHSNTLAAEHVPEHLIVSASLSPAFQRGPAVAAEPQALRERIMSFGGIPEAILADADLFKMFETIILADIAMGDAYRHVASVPLACPITVYSGTTDGAAPTAQAPAWQAFTSHPLRLRSFEGGHFFLYAKPELTAAALIEDLGLVADTI